MILIKNGTVIDPDSNVEGEFDLLIDGAGIADLGRPGSFASATVQRDIDATGKWIVPGLIDMHVHLREPGFEWKETIQSGSEAAILGGFTTILCMPNTRPVNDNAEITRFILEKAQGAKAARVLPIGAVTVNLQGKQMAPLSELRKAGCAAFSDDGEPVYDSGIMRRALEWASMLDVPICCHEEDKSLSCGGSMNESALSSRLGLKGMHKVAEEVMIARDIELARTTGAAIHICHISSGRGVELVRRAKNDGIKVTCEVTPHHLVLTEEAVRNFDTNAKMSPPLREVEESAALLAGLKDGTIDCIASDHAPHESDSKDVEFAKASFGILGLQTSLPLILEFAAKGEISRRRAVEALSSAAARILRIEGGNLRKGARADLAIIDPSWKWTFDRDCNRSLSLNSPFLGRQLCGIADAVLVNGRVVVEGRKLEQSPK
ncbi:MAG: dihydroorotase [Deltaproteobacteria bacterium]|nr:dihydroorotase [Deltaproteobacteria bacterium]